MMKRHLLSLSKTASMCCVFSVFMFVQTFAQVPTLPLGTGTLDSPYQIATWQNLYWISQNSAEWGKHYIQTAYIDLGNTDPAITTWDAGKGWTPIGNFTNKFTGIYDGDGHEISGLFINRPDETTARQGLFGYAHGATIQNLGVTNVDLTSGTTSGGLVGSIYSGTTVTHCFSKGSVTGRSSVGGLVGVSSGGNTISACYSIATVAGSEGGYTGGLLGYNHQSALISSYSSCNIIGTNASGAGGLVGLNYSTVSNCVWNSELFTNGMGTSSFAATNIFGKTTAEMKEYVTFYGDAEWDFMGETVNGTEDTWGINALQNDGYPFLSMQGYSHNPVYTIITLSPSGISSSMATLIGSAGDMNITQHGFCWSTTENPTLDDSKVELGTVTQTGAFTYNLTGLDTRKTYYIRAYAVIEGKTIYYGHQKMFVTMFWAGLGTETNPFQIANKTDLKNLSENSEWWSYHFIQTADISFVTADFENGGDFYNSGQGFIPIGSSSVQFTGLYDGDGHTITGLFINRPGGDEQGFFGYTDGATINNIGLINVNITGRYEVGGLIGWALSTDISNCHVSGTVTASTNGWAIGGLVGYGSSISVNGCSASGTVSGDGVWGIGGLIGYLNKNLAGNPSIVADSYAIVEVYGNGMVGGLVGYSDSYSTYTNCYATGSATGTAVNETFVGGLVGYSYQSTYTNCHATGNVLAHGGFAGGLSGYSYEDNINNCFATGSIQSVDLSGNSYVGGLAGMAYSSNLSHTSASGQVTGHFYVGGLVGKAINGLIENSFAEGHVITDKGTAGGLVGENNKCNIQYCYANGNVTGPTGSDQTGWDIGGLVGWNQDGVISNSYATGNVIGYGNVGGLVGLNWSGAINPPYLAKTTNCYSIGNVTGTDLAYTGGLAGRNRGAIDYCHWDVETSVITTGIGYTDPGGSSIGTVSNTTTEMKTQSTFTDSGWDFNDTWAIDPLLNSGYPYLGWQDCFNPTDGGTIAAAQTICAGTSPNQLTSQTLPSGYLGTIEYKWQMTTVSPVITWNDISNSNLADYQPGLLSQTTWFRRLARTCTEVWNDAAASNEVEINIEATPVAGTLSKTPDEANVCEGDDVSATLTSGAGGNGADELEFRTHDGSGWSSWADYFSGNNITTSGLTEVEIRTRRMADHCNDSDYETVSWAILEIIDLNVRVNIRAASAPSGQVKFTAYPVNGGANPTYKWFKNDIEIIGVTGNELITACKSDDVHWVLMQSSLPCTEPATSNAMCTY